MTDLDDLVQALRSEHSGASERAPATRSRVMVSLHESKHRRRRRWSFGIPLAAVLVGSTAWAGASGHLGPSARAAVESVAAWLGATEAAPPAAPSAPPAGQRASAEQLAAPAAVDPTAADIPETDTPEAEPAAPETPTTPPVAALAPPDASPDARHALRATPHASPSAAGSAAGRPQQQATGTQATATQATLPRPAPPAEAAPPAPAADPHLIHYREAHDAQFAQGDCAAAVAGYERYLREAPKGALVPEARFHRAVCLVRLGRHEQAERALRPFAEGRYGAYRQEDAQKLLNALQTR